MVVAAYNVVEQTVGDLYVIEQQLVMAATTRSMLPVHA
jgi:hypothetical protein